MSEAPERVLIEGGRRQGRTLQAEPKFRAALDEGKQVFTQRNGVWFEVTLTAGIDGGEINYTALTGRPEGV